MGIFNLLARVKVEGTEKAESDLKKLGKTAEHTGDTMKRAGSGVRSLGSALVGIGAAGAVSTIAMGGLGGMALQAALKADSLTRALASVSSGASDLRGQLARLQEVAKLPGLNMEQAVRGSVTLQAAGLSAQLAERSIAAFGNALASAGRGAADLEGVTIALSQIASKGTISAEEIGQLAERVPQIRRALQAAFGTADTEKIQKLGISATDAIARIVTEMEKLPRVSGGISNALENLADGAQRALLPLGKGIAAALESAIPGLENIAAKIGSIGRQVGEVFAAIGRSGVLTEVLGAYSNLLSKGINTGPLESIGATFLSILKNLPAVVSSAFGYVASVFTTAQSNFQEIGRWLTESSRAFRETLVQVGQFLLAVVNKIGTFAADLFNRLTPLLKTFGSGLLHFSPLSQGLSAIFSDRDKVAPINFKPFPTFDRSGLDTLAADRERFAAAIRGGRGPLADLPSGLSFGNQGSVGRAAMSLTSALQESARDNWLERLLAGIERNTRDAVDVLSLRKQGIGGGQLAGLGVTSAELSKFGISGHAPGREDYGKVPASSELERAYRRVSRQEQSRMLGRGRVVV